MSTSGRQAWWVPLLLGLLPIVLIAPAPVVPAGAVAPVPAEVAPSDGTASLTLTDVRPASLRPGDTLTLIARLSNDSADVTLGEPTAVLRVDSDPLQEREEIRRAAGEPLYRYGDPDYRFTVGLTSLGPGEEAEVALTVPLEDLGLPASGVYVMGVDVLATLPSGVRPFVASARSVVPVLLDESTNGDPDATGRAGGVPNDPDAAPTSPRRPVQVASVWRLDARPALLPDGRLVDDALLDRLSPKGDLRSIVDIAPTASPTWLVDGDVVRTAEALSAGYELVGAGEPQTGSPVAQAWLAALAEAAGGDSDVRASAYASPDLDLMLAGGLSTDEAARTLAPALTDTGPVSTATATDVSTLVFPRGGWVSPAALAPLVDAGARHVLLLADAVTTADGRAGTQVRPTGVLAGNQAQTPDVTLADPGLYDALATGWEGVRRPVDTRQRLLAETFLAATQSRRPLVLVTPHEWSASPAVVRSVARALTRTPWIEPATLGELPRQGRRLSPNPEPTVSLPPLEPADVPTEVAALTREASELSSLLVDEEVAQRAFRRSGHRALSTAWRAAPVRGSGYADRLGDGLAGSSALVAIAAPPQVTLSSRTGQFPITVVNDLAADIRVQLRLSPSNMDRLTVVDPSPQVVRAGARETVRITAQAAGNGRVPLQVRMETVDGLPVGSPVTTVVVATDYGLIGWAIVAVGAGLLAVMAVRRVRGGREAE